jgi:hypothetical protein
MQGLKGEEGKYMDLKLGIQLHASVIRRGVDDGMITRCRGNSSALGGLIRISGVCLDVTTAFDGCFGLCSVDVIV